MSCSASACLAALSRGHWSGSLWRWDDAPSCCQFGQVGPERAQRLLAGRKLVFVGDSQTRRHMWAIVDAVGGARVRRRHGFVVPDSHRAFDEAAIGLNDTIYDSQRAYHAGQTVLLNVRTGRWVLLDPKQLCGVDQTHWMTDHRLVGALERGNPEPWPIMRGAHYRLLLNVGLRTNASGPDSIGGDPRRAVTGAVTAERVRQAVQALARDALQSWGCQKPRAQDCSYEDAIQRNCARHLAVLHGHMPARELGAGGGGAGGGEGGGVGGGGRPEFLRLTVLMGEVGGTCQGAARELQAKLTANLANLDAEHPSMAPRAALRRRRLSEEALLNTAPDPTVEGHSEDLGDYSVDLGNYSRAPPVGNPHLAGGTAGRRRVERRRRLRAVPDETGRRVERERKRARALAGGGARGAGARRAAGGDAQHGAGGAASAPGYARTKLGLTKPKPKLGSPKGGFVPTTALRITPQVAATLAMIGRRGPVLMAPYCQSYCRRTHHLECVATQPFVPALERAVGAHAGALGVQGPSDPNLAVLTFLYAASMEAEMTSTMVHWGERSYGHGADVIFVGATWASTMRTTRAEAAIAIPIKNAPVAQAAESSAHHDASSTVTLAWDAKLESSWRSLLRACAKASRCVLRTVPEHLRQPEPAPYRAFTRHVASLAAAAGVGLIDAFPGTWEGTKAGVMAHHDSTRIHYSDTGRIFLAQLTLNAMPWLQLPMSAELPPPERVGEVSVEQIAKPHLMVP